MFRWRINADVDWPKIRAAVSETLIFGGTVFTRILFLSFVFALLSLLLGHISMLIPYFLGVAFGITGAVRTEVRSVERWIGATIGSVAGLFVLLQVLVGIPGSFSEWASIIGVGMFSSFLFIVGLKFSFSMVRELFPVRRE